MARDLFDPITNSSVFTFFSEFDPAWEGQHVLEAVMFILILTCAVTGNVMVLVGIIRNRRMHSVTNYFIANLAIADLLYVTWTPFIFTTRITMEWVFGEGICKLVTYMQFVSGVCSILTMMMISIERYFCVCATPDKKLTLLKFGIITTCIWILSVAFPIPVAVAQSEKFILIKDVKKIYCGMTWSNEFHVDIYLICMVMLFFVCPLIVITVQYIQIFKTVKRSAKNACSTSNNGSINSHRHDRQVRLTKMFTAIVVLFVVMWLPFFVLSFLAIYFKKISSTQFTITIILSSANTCINPIMYGYFNTKFRKEFKKMCRCFWRGHLDFETTYSVRGSGTQDATTTN